MAVVIDEILGDLVGETGSLTAVLAPLAPISGTRPHRVPWYGLPMSAAASATARLMETPGRTARMLPAPWAGDAVDFCLVVTQPPEAAP
jgi:hypothetical protein